MPERDILQNGALRIPESAELQVERGGRDYAGARRIEPDVGSRHGRLLHETSDSAIRCAREPRIEVEARTYHDRAIVECCYDLHRHRRADKGHVETRLRSDGDARDFHLRRTAA